MKKLKTMTQLLIYIKAGKINESLKFRYRQIRKGNYVTRYIDYKTKLQ